MILASDGPGIVLQFDSGLYLPLEDFEILETRSVVYEVTVRIEL